MILRTLNPREIGQVDEGLFIEDEYHPDQLYLVLGKASLSAWLRQEWDKGRSPNPDPELLADERLRYYDVILLE
jgi:hypothetical protein